MIRSSSIATQASRCTPRSRLVQSLASWSQSWRMIRRSAHCKMHYRKSMAYTCLHRYMQRPRSRTNLIRQISPLLKCISSRKIELRSTWAKHEVIEQFSNLLMATLRSDSCLVEHFSRLQKSLRESSASWIFKQPALLRSPRLLSFMQLDPADITLSDKK